MIHIDQIIRISPPLPGLRKKGIRSETNVENLCNDLTRYIRTLPIINFDQIILMFKKIFITRFAENFYSIFFLTFYGRKRHVKETTLDKMKL